MEIKLIRVNGSKRFRDYEIQNSDGVFKYRTYFAKIKGEPEIMEKDNHNSWDYYSYSKMIRLNEEGVLVPNLGLALLRLKDYVA